MKKLLLLITLFVGVIYFAQGNRKSAKDYFLDTQKKADSLQINYPEINNNLEDIEILTDFKDLLLFNNNYKNIKKRNLIISEFKFIIPEKTDYNTEFSTEEKIINFYDLQIILAYTKAYAILRDKMISVLESRIMEDERKLIIMLRTHNYPVEKYNKLTPEEKNIILSKINEGYVFP